MPDGNVVYNTSDGAFNIPVEKEQSFLSKYPDARRVYVNDQDTFAIPKEKEHTFLSKYPNAKPLVLGEKKDEQTPETADIHPQTNELAGQGGQGFKGLPSGLQKEQKPPRDVYANLTPSDKGIASTGLPKEAINLDETIQNKIKGGAKLDEEEIKKFSYNQTLNSVWRQMLTQPKFQDEKTRNEYLKIIEDNYKDLDKEQIANLKKTAETAASIQQGYEQAREYAHEKQTPESFSVLGSYQAAAGDYDLAHKTFTYMMNKYPDRSEGYTGNAYLSALHGDIKGAIDFTTQALKVNPDDVNALNERAKYLGLSGKNDLAFADADKSVKNAKYGTDEAVEAYKTRAEIYKNLGKTDLAGNDEATADAMVQAQKAQQEYKVEPTDGKVESEVQKPILNEKGEITGYEKYKEPTDFAYRYLKGIPKDIIEGVQKATKGEEAELTRTGDWKKNTLDQLSGMVQVGFGVAKVLPNSAASMALWTGGTEIAEKVAPKTTAAITAPITTIFNPQTEEGKEAANMLDQIAFMIEAHQVKRGLSAAESGLSNIAEPKGETYDVTEPSKANLQPIQTPEKKVEISPENVTKDQYVNSKLDEYQTNNKKFLEGLKKSNIDQYNSILTSAKNRFENEYKPTVTSEDLKLKGVQDKIVNKQALTPNDVETLTTFVNNLSPDEVKEATSKLKVNPETLAPVQGDTPEITKIKEDIKKSTIPKEPEPKVNDLDKANQDLTRLQSRLGKAAENKKVGIQKQIDAKNKQIEELSKVPAEPIVEEKPIVAEPKVETPIPTVTPEVSSDGKINDRDNKGIQESLDKGVKNIPSSSLGKEIEPHPEVKTDLKTVAKELKLDDIEVELYNATKDLPVEQREKAIEDFQEKKIDESQKRIDDLEKQIDEKEDKRGIKALEKALEKEVKNNKYLTNYQIADAEDLGKIIDRINTRLETRRNVKIGSDLFPEQAGVKELKTITRNPKLPKGQYIEGADTDIKFSTDKTVKGKNVLAPLGERHYIDGKDNSKNFLAGAKRSRLVRPQPEGELDPNKLMEGETAHEGAPVNNWRNEGIQGDGRLTRLSNMTDAEKENYYNTLKSNAKKLGFTPEQVEEAKQKGYVLQRLINATHDQAAELSQKDEGDLIEHDAADQVAQKLNTLTPDQVNEFAHLFDGRPLEDILSQSGTAILHALNKAGVISDLTTERMKIGNTINPDFIPHLVDAFRSVITGDLNDPVPLREHYNAAPEIVKNSLDRIIPDILKLPSDKRPVEYFQKALLVLGNKGEIPTRDFVENIKGASPLDKAFIPFVLDPISKHTIPNLIRDYKLELQGIDYEGQKPKTMSDAMGNLFLETDNNPLNEKERELSTQINERGTTVQPNQQSTPGKETGAGIDKDDNRTEGQKIVDRIFGTIPVMEKISDLPDNLSITQNNILGDLITGVRGAYRRLAKLDNRDASHAISYFHNERTGTDKAMNLYSVQSLEQLNNADPETNLYQNKSKVYQHFDELQRAQDLGLPLPEFKADNNAQQILYDFTNAIKQRADRLIDELKDVQGLPDSYLNLVKETSKGFLHRMLGEHYVPMDIAKEREAKEAEIQAYKEGRKDLKDIGGVRGLFQKTMAEEQVKPQYRGFLGNDNSDIFEPRKTLEAVNKKTGEKSIVEFQDGRVVRWKDGKQTPIGEYKDLPSIRKENSYTDKQGNEYSLNDGLVSDIKKETGKNYIEHPVLSAIESIRALSKVHSTVKFFQSIKNAPEVSQFMKVLDKGQLNTIESIKSAGLKEDSKASLQGLIDQYNANTDKPIEYSDTDTPNDLTNKLLEANNMPPNFLNEFQAAKGIIRHPIFDDTYFKRNALESIQNALMDDKPKNNELIRGYLNWVYLGIEGTGHALNLATNTAINAAAEVVGGNFKGLGDSFLQAEKAIREQNDLHKYLQSHGVANFFNVNPDYTEAVVNILKQNIADNPEKNKPLNEAIANMASDYKEGFQDLKDFGGKVNKGLIWWMNDMNTYSTILKEASNQGLDLKNIDFNNPEHTAKLDNAIKVSAKNYNSYHIAPEELFGGKAGRIIANGLRNRGVFIFTNYLVGNVKVLAGQIEQLAAGAEELGKGGDPDTIRRANTAIDRIAVGAAMLYGIQQFENWRNKDKKQTDVYHEENRPGLLRIPYEVQRHEKGEINIGELATKIIHPTPLLMNFPNWVKNQNGLGGVNDPDGNIFSSDGLSYLMNGASIPKVNQQTTGEKINDFLKPRLGLEYDVKLSPEQHGLVTQLRNFNEFVEPEMKAITKSLQEYHKKINSGQPIETKDKIDETGYNNFLHKAYYSSGNILNHWEDYIHQRIAELQKSDTTSDDDKKLWIERYENMLPKIDTLKAKNKEEFEKYMKNRNDTSAYREGKLLQEIGKVIKIQ